MISRLAWKWLLKPAKGNFRMTSTTTHETSETANGRFGMMLAHFALGRRSASSAMEERSVLCRILDGRDLDEVCPIDSAMLTLEERAHYHATLRDRRTCALAVRTRAELRRMLGREIGMPPNQVPLRMDVHGKPRCMHPLASDLDFSVAHSDECSLIILGEAAGIGVDVEEIDEHEPSDEHLEIAFTEDEFLAWSCLPDGLRRRAFAEAWTIKEASLKAMGVGLDGSPHEVQVHFDAAGNAWPIFPGPGWAFERIRFCPRHVASFVAMLTPACFAGDRRP
ncbi:4'-phosphopantetheinyl transferase superfamily protein [Verrucomicrobium sp. BvORR106]|uniref:4'-phosphopantetheinyl transferase family protein n=1 Tax=Verrucomicrobium sp. BvORR106 TaxID=1403819 RepID=UPI000AC91B90|nr:4'-phosphopantetheinyl transferase superfamily protein [Verrucomicrobium sp. BvORR106]